MKNPCKQGGQLTVKDSRKKGLAKEKSVRIGGRVSGDRKPTSSKKGTNGGLEKRRRLQAKKKEKLG